MRAAAGVVALCLIAAVVFGGSQLAMSRTPVEAAMEQSGSIPTTLPTPSGTTDPTSMLGGSSNSNSAPDPDAFTVQVDKIVAIAAEANGSAKYTSTYAQTSATGSGSTTVTVPVGTPNPVNLTSFSKLDTDGDSIIYPIETSGTGVSQQIAGAGPYNQSLPVGVDIKLKVNGEEVDPNSATSFSGRVELTYNFINNTASTETLSYKDADGNVQQSQHTIAVPFSVGYTATFNKGWANINAPWAQGGFSSGLTLTGSTTLKPTIFNKYNPNASLSLTADTENASLPSAQIKFQAVSATGETTISKAGEEAGKITNFLEKAVPMLAGVQSAVGKGASLVAKLLKTKVDPILKLISRLHVNPKKWQGYLTEGGGLLQEGGDELLQINALLYKYGGLAAKTIATASGPAAQKQLSTVITLLEGAEVLAPDLVKQMTQFAALITEATGFLGTAVPALVNTYVCPSSTPKCTWGQALQASTVDQLPTTCTTPIATNTLWGGGPYPTGSVQSALNWAITSSSLSSANKAILTTLKNNLIAQQATPVPGGSQGACTATATSVMNQMDGLLAVLGTLSTALTDLIPLINELSAQLPTVINGLQTLLNRMPAINENMTNAARLLSDTSTKDYRAIDILNSGVKEAIADLRPVIDKVAQTANLLGAAALPLEARLDALPSVINELGNGTLGFFVGEVKDLASLGNNLTVAANEMAAASEATNKKFASGVGFPYGNATGKDTTTSGAYLFTVASAEQSSVTYWPTVVFAIVMLIIGAAVSIWLTRRRP